MQADKKLILVIDDEEGACEFIRSFLEDRGYETIFALNGRDALKLIKERAPDLVFLDIRMPEMNGMEMLSELKKQHIDANVVLMTGVDEERELEKARALGAKDLVEKPVELKILNEMVKKHLR